MRASAIRSLHVLRVCRRIPFGSRRAERRSARASAGGPYILGCGLRQRCAVSLRLTMGRIEKREAPISGGDKILVGWRVQASRASRREFNPRGVRWFRRPFRIACDIAGNGLEATTN